MRSWLVHLGLCLLALPLVAQSTRGELHLKVTDLMDLVGGGRHLKPEQLHQLVEKYGEDVVFFDGRNTYEAAVGRFKNAVSSSANK